MKVWILRTPKGKVSGIGMTKCKAIYGTTSGMHLMNYRCTGLHRDVVARGWTVTREEWEKVEKES